MIHIKYAYNVDVNIYIYIYSAENVYNMSPFV